MYYYISGDLVKSDSSSLIVDNNGIAYILYASLNTISAVGAKDKVKLYTYLSVKEDAHDLYGFATEDELSAFKLLIEVSGVGPKAALAILSVLTPERLAMAVSSGDVKAISAAQGVGKKIAERVVLELKDKFKGMTVQSENGAPVVIEDAAGNAAEAINALIVLGYTRAEAGRAVGTVDTAGMEIDDIIRAALKMMI
ncbi:MAG: Holliday junction branch migration protein RuvA [Clostridia bacterium]|nr:Holliday junction branch migration protein RuvA [Clostridia bacterium]